jgi:hypothetical protein
MRPLNHIHDASFRDKLLASKPISESGKFFLLSWIVCLARTEASQARSNQYCVQKCMMKNFKRAWRRRVKGIFFLLFSWTTFHVLHASHY